MKSEAAVEIGRVPVDADDLLDDEPAHQAIPPASCSSSMSNAESQPS